MNGKYRYVKKSFILVLLAFVAQVLLSADPIYVDCDAVQSGNGSANAPFKTIQEAVIAAEEGATIRVAAGIYAEGETKCVDGGYARVCVTKKSLKIQGSGRDRSFIVGTKGSGVAGLGEEAVRCVSIEADDVEISGFTISNGHTTGTSADDHSGMGGGVYSHNKANGYIVDCTIINCCAAKGGAIACPNPDFENERLAAVRCLITDNRASASSKTWCDYGASLYWCIVTRHYNDGRSPIEMAPKVINCTLDNNCAHHYFHGCKDVCNTFAGRYSYKGGAGSSGWDNFANVYFTSVTEDKAMGGTSVDCIFAGEEKQFVSPLEHDFRPLPSAPVLNAGNGVWLEKIPEAYRNKDYLGGAVNPDAGTIAIGAIQNPCTDELSGMVVFSSTDTVAGDKFVFSGVTNGWNNQEFYCHTTNWPSFLRFRPLLSGGTNDYGFAASGADAYDRFPLADGSYLLMPHPAETLNLKLVKAKHTFHADPHADRATADGTPDKPFSTLQDAVDAVESGSYAVIYAAEGTYDRGGSSGIGALSNRVAISGKHIRLVGKAGAEKTFIVGGEDPGAASDAYGCGVNAVRCICAAERGAVQGFTLTGGRAGAGNADTDANKSGTVLALGCGFQVLDCIVSNNCSGISAVGFGWNSSHLLFSRCRIMENRTLTATHSGAYALLCDFTSCLVAKNRSSGAENPVFGNSQAELVYDSTIYAEGVDGNYLGYGSGARSTGTHRNSIFAGFGAYRSSEVYGIVIDTSIRNADEKLTYVKVLSGTYTNGVGIANFVDAEDGDFRVSAASAACGYASYDAERDTAAYRLATMSLDGVVPDFSENGKYTAGAYRNPVPVVSVKGEGISPLCSVVNPSAGTEIAVSASMALSRPLVGFAVNGVLQEPDGTNYIYTVPVGLTGEVVIAAVYGTDWYVDARNGRDDWYGMEKYPFRRISDALQKAVSGDTVHVSPGEYNEGEMMHPTRFFAGAGASTPSRAVVKAGVTLVSEAGAKKTFIIGADDSANENGYGDGPAAVRCATVYGGGVLRGFTLTGGRTRFVGIDDAGCGGGVLAENGDALVEDCIISNCMALVGGGVERGTYRRCRIFECQTPIGNSAAGRYAHLFNCHVDRCRGGRTLGFMYRLKSCTIGPDNTGSDGKPTSVLHKMESGFTVDNCIITGGIASHGGHGTYSNCLFDSTLTFDDENYTMVDCQSVGIEDLAIEADGIPRIGSSMAVDAGNGEIYDGSLSGEFDCLGNPRFANGRRLDVGAYEADWKAAYSKVLGRGVNVLYADPAAEEATGCVYLPEGRLELDWTTVADSRYVFNMEVTGTGTLKWRDGDAVETFTAADGAVRMAFRSDGTDRRWGFEYESGQDDDGGAILSNFKWEVGLAISIR